MISPVQNPGVLKWRFGACDSRRLLRSDRLLTTSQPTASGDPAAAVGSYLVRADTVLDGGPIRAETLSRAAIA